MSTTLTQMKMPIITFFLVCYCLFCINIVKYQNIKENCQGFYMKNSILSNNVIQQIGFGLTAAALIGSYCVCACAALGQGLLSVLLCCAVCFLVSLKKGIFRYIGERI